MLASDDNNPAFVGATDPDARLHVIFFKKPIQNAFKTEKEGRPIFEDAVMVKIMVPGDTLSIIETPVRDEHKRRFPKHWAYFESTQGADNLQQGTPLSQWPILQPSQVEELKALKFYTVENIANAGDDHLSRIGMAGGMGHFALREKAIRYLTVAKDVATVDHAKQELEAFKAQAAEKEAKHAAEMEELRKQVAALAALAVPKKGPGRPRKVKDEATA
jgi:ribosomal protein L29